MIIETVYLINTTRPEHVAWLTDPANFDGHGGGAIGDDGFVFLTREQMDYLGEESDSCGQHAGDLEWSDDHDGLLIWLPHGDGLWAVSAEAKPHAVGAPRPPNPTRQ